MRPDSQAPDTLVERAAPAGVKSLGVFVAGGILTYVVAGALTAVSVDDWYRGLTKPTFNPPDWLFAPVWAVLYVLMAVAAWRVWRLRDHPRRPRALALFTVQLVLNVAWSALFFALQAVGLALLEIGVLWLAIVATTVAFHRVDAVAAGLMVPYLLWVSFAAVLNGAIWRLN